MADLVDIIAPIAAPPAPPPYGWIALGVGVLLLVMGWWSLRWHRRTRRYRQAGAQLRRTERALNAGTLEARQAAHAIAHALQQVQIRPEGPVPADPGWVTYRQRLHRARFAPHTTDTTTVRQLLAEAHRWIKPTSC